MDCSMPVFPVHHQHRQCSNSCPLGQWCHPTISSLVVPFFSCPQSFPASDSFPLLTFCIRWPKYWSFSFSINPSIEYSGLISFRMDRFDLHAVQGALKSLLQHLTSKASILQCSAFFIAQLLYLYITTRKTIALTIWTFANDWDRIQSPWLCRVLIGGEAGWTKTWGHPRQTDNLMPLQQNIL